MTAPYSDMVEVDGAQEVHKLDTKKAPLPCKTFSKYADVFCMVMLRDVRTAQRVDVLWDEHRRASLKSQLRESRGEGEPMRVSGNTQLPQNRGSFLRNNSNNAGLFSYLADALLSLPVDDGEILITTKGDHAFTSGDCDLAGLSPCSDEECDTRLFLHLAHGCDQGYRDFLFKASDTDVVQQAVFEASNKPHIKIWIRYGTLSIKYIPAHTIAIYLGSPSRGLPFFHGFTGCDVVSFYGIGKITAWNV